MTGTPKKVDPVATAYVTAMALEYGRRARFVILSGGRIWHRLEPEVRVLGRGRR